MKSSDIVALISFAPLALAQIPPASFGFPSVPQQLLLSFQNGRVQTTPGVHYAANSTELSAKELISRVSQLMKSA